MYQEYVELIWFFIGIFAYRTVSTILDYSHMAEFVRETYEQSLKYIGVVAEDVAFIKAIKYRHMADSGFSQEQIKEVEEIDDRAFVVWKNVFVSHAIINCPKHFRGYIKFQDWRGAMQELNKIHERESKLKRVKNVKKQK